MISVEDQNALFLLIANKIKKDIECTALGGTAMMYKNYKNATKDIDIVFNSEKDRILFIDAISSLGYKEKNNIKDIYPKEKLKIAPLVYTRDDEERFDLFIKKVFKTEISKNILERSKEIRDFNGKNLLRIKILADEDLILLKSITSRKKDYEDIEIICKNNPHIDWKIITEEALNQFHKGDGFIVLDLEETMQKLKHSFFIKKEHFDKLYNKF
jgi:predicted nucleotidyltransferase